MKVNLVREANDFFAEREAHGSLWRTVGDVRLSRIHVEGRRGAKPPGENFPGAGHRNGSAVFPCGHLPVVWNLFFVAQLVTVSKKDRKQKEFVVSCPFSRHFRAMLGVP